MDKDHNLLVVELVVDRSACCRFYYTHSRVLLDHIQIYYPCRVPCHIHIDQIHICHICDSRLPYFGSGHSGQVWQVVELYLQGFRYQY